MSVPAQTQPRNEGAFGRSKHDGILLSQDRKGWDLCYQFISDWGMLVRSICLLCWKLMRSQIPGVYIDPFTRLCLTRFFCEYQPCCLLLGIPVWQEGLWSAEQVPHQLQQQHWDNPDRRSLQSQNRSYQGCTCEETTFTSLLSAEYKLWHDWTEHTYQHPCCFIWGVWLRSRPSASSRVRHCTASPELAAAGTRSKLEAQLQRHLTNDPMPGALLLFPGRYPDWQGTRNLKNRCLGLLCYCVFNGFSQERRWKGRALRLGRQRWAPAARSRSWRTPHKGGPTPRCTAGHSLGKLGHTLQTAMEILQHAPARFLPAFRKYWFIIFLIK